MLTGNSNDAVMKHDYHYVYYNTLLAVPLQLPLFNF